MDSKPRLALAARSNTPRIPLFQAAVLWLLLDRFNAPIWAWVVFGVVMGVFLVAYVVAICRCRLVTLEELEARIGSR